jgi:glycosyltransferase involved in cell wall biosynthesis
MMKIGMLTSWLSHRSGGLCEAVSRLVRGLQADPEYNVKVFGLADHCTAAERERWGPSVVSFPTRGPDSFGHAPGLAAALKSADLDILHVHGLWMYYSIASAGWIRITGRPCVISPHGMLDPWALRNSGWKKQLALAAYERSHLESAACLHALCGAEAQAMRDISLRNAICIIPNGLDTPTSSAAGAAVWRDRVPPGARILLYLGRLHPKKGLINLLHAWQPFAGGPDGDWHLAIAGWDQGGYESKLRRVVNQLGMASRVHFLGPLFGTDKAAAYAVANAFILPSVSEGLPMVILEAWSHGLPVLMTRACNLPEGFTAGAALEIGTDSEGIGAGLDLLARLSDEQRRAIGDNGRRLCRERFSQAHSSEMMRMVYRWLLNLGPRPDCVHDGVVHPERANSGMLLESRIPRSAGD